MRAPLAYIILSALLLGVLPSQAATINGTVRVKDGRVGEAVVYLESAQDSVSRPAPVHVVIDQKNLAFVPAVLPVVRGTVVTFTNSDDIVHNVFTPSEIAGKFNLGTRGREEAWSVVLNEPGEVLLLCNIHMEMEAHILVLKDPYFAVVAQDGNYRIPEVPPGTYTLRIWHRRVLPYTRTLDVPATGDLTVDLQLER